jgi:hypothetical protein
MRHRIAKCLQFAENGGAALGVRAAKARFFALGNGIRRLLNRFAPVT